MSDLKRYEEKRDTRESGEPSGRASKSARRKKSSQPRFVIQKHDASSLHYDFRLEADGVLISWAVPKGPSTDPSEKRLAIQTEDHPLDYIDFEGTIPHGNYGAGSVIVWDTGTFKNLRTEKKDDGASVTESVNDGLVEVELNGKKLSGGYALKRIRDEGEKSQWLLIKKRDKMADARRNPVSTQPESVLSGRKIEDLD